MTSGLYIFLACLLILFCIIFFVFSSVRESREVKKANEKIKKAYEQTAKYNEVKKENEKKIKDMENTRGANSVNNAFELLHNVSQQGQKRNRK